MNTTIMQLTMRSLLGRKRSLFFLVLTVILLGLAILFRVIVGQDDEMAVHFLGGLTLGTVIPLVCLIAGTGSIGMEIDDGSIIYLLAKPLQRRAIIISKLIVAIGCSVIFGVVPMLISGFLLVESSFDITLAYVVGSLVASVVYCALFLMLAVVTRQATIVGLLYALIWETTIAGLVPGARALSVRQWSVSIAEKIVGNNTSRALGIDSDVGFGIAIALLFVVFTGSTWFAIKRLKTIRLAVDE